MCVNVQVMASINERDVTFSPTRVPQSALRGGTEDFVMIFTATQTDTVMGSLYSLTAAGTERG